MSAAMGKFQQGLHELEELASSIEDLPIEARGAATELMVRNLQIMAGRLKESTDAINRALFGKAVREIGLTQVGLVSRGQAALDQLVGATVADISFGRRGALNVQTTDGRAYRIRAMRMPSGEDAIFATTPLIDRQLNRNQAFLQPAPMRMTNVLRQPARATASQTSGT